MVPNNGNPGGAYNVASAEPVTPQAAPANPYAWVEPSPYMGMVNTILQEQDVRLEEMIQSITNPQQKGMFDIVSREGNLGMKPLNDFGLPMETDDTWFPMTNPRDVRLPVLPE